MRTYSLLSEETGQGALEYLAIIGGVVILVTVVTLAVKNSMYKPALDAEASEANKTFEGAQ